MAVADDADAPARFAVRIGIEPHRFAVALADLHACPARAGLGSRHGSLLASSRRNAPDRASAEPAVPCRATADHRCPVSRPARPELRPRCRAQSAGRSSDSRARAWLALPTGRRFPGRQAQCCSRRADARRGRRSFPLTAAGQSRNRTGFPLASVNLDGPQNQLRATPYVEGAAIPITTCRAGVSRGRIPLRPGLRRVSRFRSPFAAPR